MQTKDFAEEILIQLPHCAVYTEIYSKFPISHLLTQLISSIWISHHPRILLVGQSGGHYFRSGQIKSKNFVVSAWQALLVIVR